MSLTIDAGLRRPIVYAGAPSSGKTVLGDEIIRNGWDVMASDSLQSGVVEKMLHAPRFYSESGFKNAVDQYFFLYDDKLKRTLSNGNNNVLFVEGTYVDFAAMLKYRKQEIPEYLLDAIEEMREKMHITLVFFLKMPPNEYKKRIMETESISNIRMQGEKRINDAVQSALDFESVLRDNYKNFGFCLHEIEPGTPEERLRIIRNEISDQF
ncbi:AAA family ATPase [Candidatus Woesearchaeota archaeon]|nr:AAA family ATPase [Candidatus Woesearchaeota archaeon]